MTDLEKKTLADQFTEIHGYAPRLDKGYRQFYEYRACCPPYDVVSPEGRCPRCSSIVLPQVRWESGEALECK